MRENKVLYQIRTLEKMIIRNFICENKLGEECLTKLPKPTPTQMQIIEYILEHKNEDIYQKDLEEILNLRRATVSGVLHTMEKNGLIERVTDTSDTRTKKIILNQKTKDIFKRNEKRMEEIEGIITKDISKEDLETFSKVVNLMKENMRGHIEKG
ncbi:MAG: MarR family transcriptional regulator [Clostridia bacterium]|nr:MarR family transcriptional regulator [Clostridia bacterium]